MDPNEEPAFNVVVRLCEVVERPWGRIITPKQLGSRVEQIERVLEHGIDYVDRQSGRHVHVDLSIANHEDETTSFLYASHRVVINAEHEGLLRKDYPDLFDPIQERIGDTTILTTINKEIDALTVVAQINATNKTAIASVDHVFWTNQGGHVICREGDDPEPADRPDGPHREDLDRGRGVRIAVIDNGIATEALTDSWLDGITVDTIDRDPLRTYTSQSSNPNDDPNWLDLAAGHGTFVTGIIRQVAPGAEIVTIRALDSDGVGLESQLAAAIDEAIAAGVQIINLSVGGYTDNDLAPVAIVQALSRVPRDVAVVAAAGNEAITRPLYPAAIPGVLGVAALDLEGTNRDEFASAELAAYTNKPPSGQEYVATAGRWTSVFVSGVENPARDRPSDRFDGYATGSGTSFSAAAMSGMIAVGLSRSAAGTSANDIVARITGAVASRVPARDEILHVDIWSL